MSAGLAVLMRQRFKRLHQNSTAASGAAAAASAKTPLQTLDVGDVRLALVMTVRALKRLPAAPQAVCVVSSWES